MAANDTTADKAQIETIAVNPDDIVEALRFNGQPPEYTGRRAAVLRLTPPIKPEMSASVYYSEEGNYYPPDMNPKPVHLRPEIFVSDDVMPVPSRNDERARAREDLDEPTEAEIGEWVATAFDVWEGEVRNRLVDELSESGILRGRDEVDVLAGVSVEYEQES